MNLSTVSKHRPCLPMVLIAVSLCIGACLSRNNVLDFTASSILTVVSLTAWLFARRRRGAGEWSYRKNLSQACLLVSLLGFGCSWHSLNWHYFHADDIGTFAQREGTPACIQGEVVSAGVYRKSEPNPDRPDTSSESTTFVIQVRKLRQGSHWRTAHGRIRIRVDDDLRTLAVGTNLELLGTLLRPNPALNPGQYDGRLALRSKRQLATLFVPNGRFVNKMSVQSPTTMIRLTFFDDMRAAAQQALVTHLADDTLPIAETLLLGIRARLDRKTRDTFVHTGLIHLLAISGLHVGILATFFWLPQRFRIISRIASLWMIAIFVIVFAQVVGARTPVVRASVLVALFCLAGGLNRASQSWNLLAAAAVVVFTVDPNSVFDVGTQLSFIAVASLIAYASESIERKSDRLETLILKYESKTKRWCRRFVSLWPPCFAVSIATAPLVLFHHNLVTPAGLLLNPIICIPLTIALYSGMVVFMTSAVSPSLASMAGGICDTAIRSMLTLIEPWDQPMLYFWLPGPSSFWLWSYYVVLSIRFGPWPVRFIPPERLICCLLLSGVALHPSITREWLHPRELRMTCIAVGHGTSILLEFPNGSVWLYDCGALGDPRYPADAIQASLWRRGIYQIDCVVVSHADADHFNALPRLVEKFAIGNVLVSPHMFAENEGSVAHLRRALFKASQEIHEVDADDTWNEGQVSCTFLHPGANAGASDNENSIVLRIDYQDHSILLTGDLEGTGLQRILAKTIEPVDVLQAPHHGSPRSLPAETARWCQPSIVCICSGLNFHVQATRRVYEAAGAQVLHTGEDGQFELRMSARDSRIRLLTPVRHRL